MPVTDGTPAILTLNASWSISTTITVSKREARKLLRMFRASKGWRKHVRRAKSAKRRADAPR